MPGIFFETQGCSANVSDSEVMAGILKEKGFAIAEKPEDSDLIIFNTCTVKGPTESFFWKRLREFDKMGRPVIIAGCIPQSEKKLERLSGHSLLGTYQVHNVADVVEETLNGNTVVLVARENESRLNLPKIRKNELIEITPVSHGCLGSCTFCKTKHARGQLYSYKPEDIVRHISSAVKDGVREIWLTSQDNSAYGYDIGTNLAELLKKIISIPRDFRVRVGMSNPKFILDFLDELIWVFNEKKIYKFLHVPVQAGSNKVLKGMGRDYVVEDFRYIVKRFRAEVPDATIATDIICGFPTETKKDFEESLKLVELVKPDVINISRFWPRPGTVAARMKKLPGSEVKERSTQMTRLFHKVARENNEAWLGRTTAVYFTEEGKNGSYIGRNPSYKQVVVRSGDYLIGKSYDVKITEVSQFDIKGDIVK